jgi:hypothetical protein
MISRFPKFIANATALVCVLVIVIAAEAVRIKDEPNGFNGHSCGAQLAKYQSFKLVKDLGESDFAGSVKVYENPGESLTLDQVPLSKIRYRFVGDQLESVQHVFEGKENRDKLLRWIEGQYGPAPAAERRVITSVQWFGDQTTISLSFDIHTKHGNLWFTCQALNHLLNEPHRGLSFD